MKKIIFIIAAFMLSIFATAQTSNVSRRINPGDSLTVSVKFGDVKFSKEESATQELVNTLLTNSVQTNNQLSSSINKLTSAVEKGIELGQQSKLEKMGITRETVMKTFKRNNTIKLISLIPALLFVLYAMGSFILQKGLDIKHLLTGTAVMALYALIASGVLYGVLSLVFNQQYFAIKDLMSTLF
jgi:hypothetical protein